MVGEILRSFARVLRVNRRLRTIACGRSRECYRVVASVISGRRGGGGGRVVGTGRRPWRTRMGFPVITVSGTFLNDTSMIADGSMLVVNDFVVLCSW